MWIRLLLLLIPGLIYRECDRFAKHECVGMAKHESGRLVDSMMMCKVGDVGSRGFVRRSCLVFVLASIFLFFVLSKQGFAAIHSGRFVSEDGVTLNLSFDSATSSYADASLANRNIFLELCAGSAAQLQDKFVMINYKVGSANKSITLLPPKMVSVGPSGCGVVDIDLSRGKAVYPGLAVVAVSDDLSFLSADYFEINLSNGYLAGNYTIAVADSGSLLNISVLTVQDGSGGFISTDSEYLMIGLVDSAGVVRDSGVASRSGFVLLDDPGVPVVYSINGLIISGDFLPPYIDDLSPDRGETGVSIDEDILFDVVDDFAVDASSIELFVDGVDMAGKFALTVGSANSVSVYLNNKFINASYGRSVVVAVNASDTSGKELRDSYGFTFETAQVTSSVGGGGGGGGGGKPSEEVLFVKDGGYDRVDLRARSNQEVTFSYSGVDYRYRLTLINPVFVMLKSLLTSESRMLLLIEPVYYDFDKDGYSDAVLIYSGFESNSAVLSVRYLEHVERPFVSMPISKRWGVPSPLPEIGEEVVAPPLAILPEEVAPVAEIPRAVAPVSPVTFWSFAGFSLLLLLLVGGVALYRYRGYLLPKHVEPVVVSEEVMQRVELPPVRLPKDVIEQEVEEAEIEAERLDSVLARIFVRSAEEKRAEKLRKSKMISEDKRVQLEGFISGVFERGFAESKVRRILLERGWPADAVDSAVLKVKSSLESAGKSDVGLGAHELESGRGERAVQRLLKKGLTKGEIRAGFIRKGWKPKDIDRILENIG
jgi:hypothetical protein